MPLKYRDGQLVSKMSLEQWQRVIDANLTDIFLCGREGAAKKIELGCRGCLINISSISRAGNMGQLNYSATKAGVEAMAVVWAKEFACCGIRAASIAPRFIGTEMVMAMQPEARAKLTSGIPRRGGGAPARAYMEELMADVPAGTLDPSPVFDMTVGLESIPDGYAAMNERRALKVLIKNVNRDMKSRRPALVSF